jgi:hypothetical protein
MSFSDLPTELIQCFIAGYISEVKDLGSTIQVSKKMKEAFDTEETWKRIFIREKAKKGYKQLLKNHEKSKRWFVDPLTTEYIIDTPLIGQMVNIMVKNNTASIPFDVFYIESMFNLKMIKLNTESVKPGKAFFRTLTFNRKIVCLPTKEWILDNPVSNVGFSFVTHIKDVCPITKGKMGILKNFEEPNPEKMKPIKGLRKEYENYKKELMKRIINKKKLNHKKYENDSKLSDMEHELKMYRKQMRIMEENVLRLKTKKKDLEYLSEIV